jgi:Bacterial SH3 domain
MKLFAILLLASFSISSEAQQNTVSFPTKNKIAFVYSFNGLNMRDSANTKSNVIKLLNFGDTVEIIEATNIKCTPVVVFVKDSTSNTNAYSENPVKENLNLTGIWIKVKSKSMEGYVNSIYLSGLPHLKNLEKKWEGKLRSETVNDFSALEDQTFLLLNKHYGISKNDVGLSKKALLYKKKINKKDEVTEVSFTKKYKDGLIYSYRDTYYDSGAGGYTLVMTKKGMSFSEAVIYCRAFFYYDNAEYKRELGFYKDEDGKYNITRYGEGGGCTGEIYKNKAGDWEITFGCGGC